MSVLMGWEPAILLRRRPVRPARRPFGLAAAAPVRPPVTSCAPCYARRRAIALLVAATVAAFAVVALVLLGAAVADDGVPRRTAVVEVRSGETLWELAGRVAPQSPPRAVVARIQQLNGMRGATVYPGQPLLVPDGR